VPDEQAASALVEVGLCERERLMDPQTGSPEHDNQPKHPPTVSAVPARRMTATISSTYGESAEYPSTFVRWDPLGVMAAHRRRRARPPGGVQQLMSRHGSLL
jgi:hypothetical protein